MIHFHLAEENVEALVSVADVKITMTLGNHDSKELDSEEGRRRGCYERTLDSVSMNEHGDVAQLRMFVY